MPRTVNEQDFALKRNQILDVAQRLIYTKGYEQMSIQDILAELGISKGAFYHYFDSKPNLLEALIDRILTEVLAFLNPMVHNPGLSALEKLQAYFELAVRWKTARRELMLDLLRIWYTDHNAIVRQKILSSMSQRAIAPLTEIVRQGMREGVLQIRFPDQIGPIIVALSQSLGDEFAALLLSEIPQTDTLERARRVIDAYNDTFERVLGAPAGSIKLMDSEALRVWFG